MKDFYKLLKSSIYSKALLRSLKLWILEDKNKLFSIFARKIEAKLTEFVNQARLNFFQILKEKIF